MFKINHYYKTDYFGIGVELSVQYDWIDEAHTQKKPCGIVFGLSLFTRQIDFGLWW